jgi:hypothetical protein
MELWMIPAAKIIKCKKNSNADTSRNSRIPAKDIKQNNLHTEVFHSDTPLPIFLDNWEFPHGSPRIEG